MAKDFKSIKSFGAGDRTIAALKFHTERLRRKGGDVSVANDHNQILGNIVDLHHRNMSMVRASLLKYEPLEPRGSSATVEVDDFEPDSEEGEEEPPVDSRSVGLNTASSIDVSEAAAPAKTGPSWTSKRGPTAQLPEVDPVSFHRQMRAATMSRNASQHLPSSVKGAYAFLKPPQDDWQYDREGVKVDLSSLRGRSFLSRLDQQAGAGTAYDMLVQIRGPNWDSDGASVKRSKTTPPKGTDSFMLAISRSDWRGEGGLSLGCSSSSLLLPAVKAKSFTTAGKSPAGALPRVSVDSTPSLPDIDRYVRPSLGGAGAGAGAPSGGLFSRLRHVMMKH